MRIDIKKITVRKAHEDLKNRQFSALELVESCLENIKEKDGETHAFLEVFEDAREQASEIDKMIKDTSRVDLEKRMHPLAGIPIAVKDNILINGRRVSGASKILENYKATFDATVISRLRGCDAIFIGRTNMDEFAMGSSTENSAFGVTHNPYDSSRVPGGSSGGSAAAVASGMAMLALGSDTGGSVRQPASFCGVVGMKPTYGAVSRNGLMALASSLDQIGPLANSIEDAELLYSVIRGSDPMDSTTLPDEMFANFPVGKFEESNIKIGVPFDLIKEGVEEEVMRNFNETTSRLKGLGYSIEPVSLPSLKYALAVYYVIMPAEASANLARYDGVKYGLHVDGGESLLGDYMKTRREGFGEEPRRRILLGTYVLSAGYYDAYYKKALEVREMIKDDFASVFKAGGVHAILTPTTPTLAFKIGEKTSDPLSMYLADIFTVPANIAGIPSISVPSGYTERDGKKLPLGAEVTTAMCREDIAFKIAKDIYGQH